LKIGKEKVGLWLIGACGGVGSTVALGIAAMNRKLTDSIGLVSVLPPFSQLDLVQPGTIVVGGHDIRSETLLSAVQNMHKKANLFDEKMIKSCAGQLRSMQRNIRPGTLYGTTAVIKKLAGRTKIPHERTPSRVLDRLQTDIEDFRNRHKLDVVVVINVASSEPPTPKSTVHSQYAKLKRALSRSGSQVLSSSSLYALAAIEAGCPYINFTPSTGINIKAIQERAKQNGGLYMGNDGKTGETLVKSVLAPMFAMRNLNVLSWIGQNILGNRDGEILKDPTIKTAKIISKDKTVSQIMGKSPMTHVSINYVPSLDDWKVAWDFIHFEGFLGTKMSMQFIWQGSDSILAAPLIIDLVRLSVLEYRNGCSGPMKHLGYFFKDPIGVKDHNLYLQWQTLVDHVTRNSTC